ncbi:DUF6328 family protein [Streptomyces sp.]|uniref:DUF6328 family protein n=1 Tax=Streptomyces sp. TaxID=1931 RepID=UPI0035BFB379
MGPGGGGGGFSPPPPTPERDTGTHGHPPPLAEHRPCTARNETPLQRADRNAVELLQALRVTRTGVQILFVFPLSLAFTSRVEGLGPFPRVTYVITLLMAVPAAALFTAPAAPCGCDHGPGRRAGLLAAGQHAGTFPVCFGLWGLLSRLVRRAGLREEERGTSASESPGTPSRDGTRGPAPLGRREASARHR